MKTLFLSLTSTLVKTTYDILTEKEKFFIYSEDLARFATE